MSVTRRLLMIKISFFYVFYVSESCGLPQISVEKLHSFVFPIKLRWLGAFRKPYITRLLFAPLNFLELEPRPLWQPSTAQMSSPRATVPNQIAGITTPFLPASRAVSLLKIQKTLPFMSRANLIDRPYQAATGLYSALYVKST